MLKEIFTTEVNSDQLSKLNRILGTIKSPLGSDLNVTKLHGLLCSLISGSPNLTGLYINLMSKDISFDQKKRKEFIRLLVNINDFIICQFEKAENSLPPLIYQSEQIIDYVHSSDILIKEWCDFYLHGTESWSENKELEDILIPMRILSGKYMLKADKSNIRFLYYFEKIKKTIPEINLTLYWTWKGIRGGGEKKTILH